MTTEARRFIRSSGPTISHYAGKRIVIIGFGTMAVGRKSS
jgi:hypothetical protein